MGSAGFCMGGGFCLLLADRGVFDATAPNYGPFPPATGVPTRSCPIVASYGAGDPLLPGAAAKLENGLAPSAVARDIKEYEGVGHSFMNDWGTPVAGATSSNALPDCIIRHRRPRTHGSGS